MKKLVIIGGGFAGAYIAKKLEDYFETTLIDTKDYFEFTPSILRTLVEPSHSNKIHAKHADYLKKAHFIRAEVSKITKSNVIINNSSIKFDYLAICAGSRYSLPIKHKNILLPSRISEIKSYAKKLKDAEKILIIGGGPVGIELAAEITAKYPHKSLAMLHSKSVFLERLNSKCHEYSYRFLSKRNVIFILNERLVKCNKLFITNKNRKIKADLAFLCTGITPNSEFLKKSCIKLDKKNYVIVNKFLQAKGHSNIFAAGDIASVQEEKTAQNSEEHAKIVAKNIMHIEKNEPLEQYVSYPRIMVISLGKYNGIITYKNNAMNGIIPGILKSIIELKTMLRYK